MRLSFQIDVYQHGCMCCFSLSWRTVEIVSCDGVRELLPPDCDVPTTTDRRLECCSSVIKVCTQKSPVCGAVTQVSGRVESQSSGVHGPRLDTRRRTVHTIQERVVSLVSDQFGRHGAHTSSGVVDVCAFQVSVTIPSCTLHMVWSV